MKFDTFCMFVYAKKAHCMLAKVVSCIQKLQSCENVLRGRFQRIFKKRTSNKCAHPIEKSLRRKGFVVIPSGMESSKNNCRIK